MFQAVFSIFAILSLWFIWGFGNLPLVDLPAFAGALAALKTMVTTPDAPIHTIYQIDFFQPYLLPFAAGLALTFVCGASAATKVLLSSAVIATPLSCIYLARRIGSDHWWGLLGFATVYGYAYGWGMISHLVAMPLALVLLAWCAPQSEGEGVFSYVRLALVGICLALCHGLVAMVAIGLGMVMIVARPIRTGSDLFTLGALVIAGLALMVLLSGAFVALPGYHDHSIGWDNWASRFHIFTSSILSQDGDIYARAGFLIFVMLAGECCIRNRTDRWYRLAPFLAIALSFFYLPSMVASKSVVPRVSSFAVAGFILLFPLVQSTRRRMILRTAIVVLVIWRLGVVYNRTETFSRWSTPVKELIELTEPGQSLMSICFNCYADGIPDPVHHHQGQWYQVYRGGFTLDYFGDTSPWILRYRPAVPKNIRFWGGGSSPGKFDIKRYPHVRYFLMRGDRATFRGERVRFADSAREIRTIDDWMLVENLRWRPLAELVKSDPVESDNRTMP